MHMTCLFCEIVSGKIDSYKFFEDENHIAILDIFPATIGQTLVLPRNHYGSYVFQMPTPEYLQLMFFAKKIAQILDKGLPAIRTCMVMEGMEIDHAHIKLYPIHTIAQTVAFGQVDLTVYRGYLSTQHGPKQSESELERLARELRKSIK